MCGQEQIPASLCHTSKFFKPRKLHVFWQVSEYRHGINTIKEFGIERQWRCDVVARELPDMRQALLAPRCRFCINIRSVQAATSRQLVEVSNDTTTAAAEVQNAATRAQCNDRVDQGVHIHGRDSADVVEARTNRCPVNSLPQMFRRNRLCLATIVFPAGREGSVSNGSYQSRSSPQAFVA